MPLERTLSIVKPDGVRANLIGEVYRRFENAGLAIVAARMRRQVQHACGDDREACALETAIDLADEIGSHAVGLDDGQGARERHSRRTSQKLHSTGAGVRAGMRSRCAGRPGSLPWVTHPRQFGVRRKCRFGKAFCAAGKAGCAGAGAMRARRPRVLQTEKLSPQPHSPLTLGFLKRKASFRPCLTKSTIVPSRKPRLAPSTNTRTPRSSNTASPGCGPSA